MTSTAVVAVFTLLLSGPASGPASKTYVGPVTETLCGRNHEAMKIAPEDKCIRDCVGDGKTYKYALLVGDKMYLLSDQETPAKFAAQKVKVTGVLYDKTNILKVERMERAK